MVAGCGGNANTSGGTNTGTSNNSGSSSSSSGSTSEDEVITLQVWHAHSDPNVIEYLQKFEETHPNIKIEQTTFVDDDYKTQSRVALSAGTTPDVWYTNTGSSLEQFVEAGGLMDITEIAEERGWTKMFDEDALKMDSVNGRLYGLPWSLYTPWMVVWANKDFFEENNLEYPVTVDDMIELAPKIRELGKEPLVFYNKDGWTGAILFGEFILQQTDGSWIDDINSGKITWTTSPEAKKAMETLKRLADANVFLTGYETMRQDTAIPVWAQGGSPLLYNGTWFTQNVGTEFDFEVEALEMLLLDENSHPKAYQNWADWCVGISPNTKHLDAAIEFLEYATAKEFWLIIGNAQGNLSPRIDANDEIEVPYYFKTEPILGQLDKPKTPFFCYAFPMPVVEVFQTQIKLVMSGQTTVDNALAAIEAEHAKYR